MPWKCQAHFRGFINKHERLTWLENQNTIWFVYLKYWHYEKIDVRCEPISCVAKVKGVSGGREGRGESAVSQPHTPCCPCFTASECFSLSSWSFPSYSLWGRFSCGAVVTSIRACESAKQWPPTPELIIKQSWTITTKCCHQTPLLFCGIRDN